MIALDTRLRTDKCLQIHDWKGPFDNFCCRAITYSYLREKGISQIFSICPPGSVSHCLSCGKTIRYFLDPSEDVE